MAPCQLFSEYPGGLWQWYSRTTRTIAKSRRILCCYGPIPRTAWSKWVGDAFSVSPILSQNFKINSYLKTVLFLLRCFVPLKSSSIFVFPSTRTFDPEMELAIFILLLRVTKFSPLMKNLFILHWESKLTLLRMLSTLHLCYPLKYAKPLSWGALEGIFQRLFYFSVYVS